MNWRTHLDFARGNRVHAPRNRKDRRDLGEELTSLTIAQSSFVAGISANTEEAEDAKDVDLPR